MTGTEVYAPFTLEGSGDGCIQIEHGCFSKLVAQLRAALPIVTRVRALAAHLVRERFWAGVLVAGDELEGLWGLTIQSGLPDNIWQPAASSLMLPSPEWLTLVALQGSGHGCERS